MTDNQRSWTKTQLIMRRLRPMRRLQPPTDPVGAWCFQLVHRAWFDPTVMVLIVLNTVVMAMEYFGQSSTYTRCGARLLLFASCRLRLDFAFCLVMVVRSGQLGGISRCAYHDFPSFLVPEGWTFKTVQ